MDKIWLETVLLGELLSWMNLARDFAEVSPALHLLSSPWLGVTPFHSWVLSLDDGLGEKRIGDVGGTWVDGWCGGTVENAQWESLDSNDCGW